MKCRWKYCKHESKDVSKEDAIVDGKQAYYHPDCYQIKQNIQRIVDLYVERVDHHPMFSVLVKTVTDLVVKDGNDSEYVLYAFQFCLNNGWHFNSPFGLRHAVKDYKAKASWDAKKERKNNEVTQMRIDDPQDYEINPIAASNVPHRNFADILR